ncbi:MAG TPA: SDR family oxidoreductase [Nevskiaceae bacterium]
MGYVGSSVAGRSVVITGGGTGIGAAIARRYAAEGAHVAIMGRRRAPLDVVAAATGGLAIAADATDRAAVEAALRKVVESFGGLDVAVANAGGHGFSPVGETDDADWASSFAANVTTAFVLLRAALPHLIESRGQAVIVSSLAGVMAGPGVAGYTVGKHALIGLTRSAARDYGKKGVRVNAVCPGWVRTPMADEEMDEYMRRAPEVRDRDQAYRVMTENVPLGRVGRPEEIAAIVRFLGSEESSLMTGAVVMADGGASIVDLPTLAFEHAGMGVTNP